jgi:Hpt domain
MQKFKKMDEALYAVLNFPLLRAFDYEFNREAGHLEEVTDEAHSLKGSSAAIALSQVESTFGEIDRYREKAKAWNKKESLSEEDARDKLSVTIKIQELLRRAKKENAAGKGWMESWYEKETGTRESF